MRTYSFKDDQVTDHRLGKCWKGVVEFLKGERFMEEAAILLDELHAVQAAEEFFELNVNDLSKALQEAN